MVAAASRKAKAKDKGHGKVGNKRNQKEKKQEAADVQGSADNIGDAAASSNETQAQDLVDDNDLKNLEASEFEEDDLASPRPVSPSNILYQPPAVEDVLDMPEALEATGMAKSQDNPVTGSVEANDRAEYEVEENSHRSGQDGQEELPSVGDLKTQQTPTPTSAAQSREQTPSPSEHFIFSPIPAAVPLPSPSISEVRLFASPPPQTYLSHPGSPAFLSHIVSPIPKISSPLARSYMSPVLSPRATPPVHLVQHGPHSSTAASFSTAHSPIMSPVGVLPPYVTYPHQLPMSPSPGHVDPCYPQSFQKINVLPIAQSRENGAISPPQNERENEHIELLARIQNAIPDLNRLLTGFRETKNKLVHREADFQQLQSEHEKAIMHKDFYIEALQTQMRKAASESAEECTKLQNTINVLTLEMENLREKQRELEESLASSKQSNEELSQCTAELEEEICRLKTSLDEAAEAHETALKEQEEQEAASLAAQKQELTELFEEIKAEDEKAAAQALEAREKELLDEHDLVKAKWDQEKHEMQESFAALQSEMEARISELRYTQDQLAEVKAQLESKGAELDTVKPEIESKIADLVARQRELDATKAELNSTIEELVCKKAEVEMKENELNEAREKHAGDVSTLNKTHMAEIDDLRDAHSTALEGLRTLHTDDIDKLRRTYEEQIAVTVKEWDEKLAALRAEGEEKQERWAKEREELKKEVSEITSELAIHGRERDLLEEDAVTREQQLQRAVDEMRTTIHRMDREGERLRRTLHSLGEATDLKSTKGDAFFIECFGQLSRLIVDLSKEHFTFLPIDPPKNILTKMPSELPSFLDNTAASREIRSAYVQHLVSKTLVFRIFQPFLFTLGRRFDKADTFFQMLSMDIRRKSVRREAFWRQQTLKAAYTTSDAKQSINVAAAVIVDEIIDQIKHFADPKALDVLLTNVRKIVKLAAETWRHARIERELVLAELPVPEAENVNNEEWQEYGVPDYPPRPVTGGAVEVDEARSTNSERRVILRTFPRIMREAAHEDFADEEEKAKSCVYSCGTVLYSDSPAVIARLQELRRKSTESLGHRSEV